MKLRSSAEILAEIKALQAKDRAYNRLQNEGGEGYERDSVSDELVKECIDAQEREFNALWTKEYWETARTVWNNELRTNPPVALYGHALLKLEKATGYTLADMKKAKAIYG